MPENGLFPPFLLIVPFGDFRKLVSDRSLLSGFPEEYSGVMKRLLPIRLLVFAVGVGAAEKYCYDVERSNN